MASARIPLDTTKPLGAKLRSLANLLASARQQTREMSLILDKYIDDTAAISTDTGCGAGNVTLLRNLVAQSAAELAAVAVVQVGVGDASGTRQLVDALSTGG